MKCPPWIALLALALPGCVGASDWTSTKQLVRTRFPQVKQVSVAELAHDLEAESGPRPPLIIDVRERAEFEVSHLPGAIHAQGEELEALAARMVEESSADRPVVLYCSVGYRSSAAAKELMAHGLTNVANLEGSIFEWANEGHTVERNGQAVREVHPFNTTWGKLLDRELWAFEPGGNHSQH